MAIFTELKECISEMGLSKDALFGSCGDYDYPTLLKEFENACQAAGGKNMPTVEKAKVAKRKREGETFAWSGFAKKAK
jgi:hypothetical protein